MESAIDLQVAGREAPGWRTFAGKRVMVHAPDGSYAAKRAAAELREAERAAEALEKLLEPPDPRRGGRVDIYLTDPLLEADLTPLPPSLGGKGENGAPSRNGEGGLGVGSVGHGDAIVRVVQPEAPGTAVVGDLTRRLVARWFGPGAAEADLFLVGIAGLVAARSGSGPSVQEAHDWVQGELGAGRPVSILTRPVDSRAATAFVAYLVESFGAGTLRQLLAAYDPARRDQAVVATYQRPLGTLEEAWRLKMRRRPRQTTAFRAFLKQLLPLLRPYWLREVEVLVLMLFGLTYTLVLPLASKYLLDTVIPSKDLGLLAAFIAVIFVIYVLNALLGMRRAYANSWINQRILLDMQEQMFARLQRLSHSFYSEAKIGDIMSRMSNDLQVVQLAMTMVLGSGIFLALNSIMAAIAILILDPLLGVLVLLVVPLFAVSYIALRGRLEAASAARQKLIGETQTMTQENLSAHAVIKAFGLQNREITAYHARIQGLFKAVLRLVTLGALFETSTALAITLGQVLVFAVGGYLAIQGNITIGTLLAFIGLLPTLFVPISALSNVGQQVQSASGALDRITELQDKPIEIADKPDAVPLPPLAQEICLENVEFSYGGDRPILQDLSLTIPAGRHVALVGPSGSGKSTVLNLLLRFWDPAGGSVTFDGHDLRDVTLESLRGQIGIVFQDTFIFDTTVRENIAIGRPGATDAEIAAAAQGARLDSFVESLPAGYDTVLGERGVRMSGGQRQRLAIARVLLRNPRLLILDEATSALDAQTEREILDTLATVTHGRTTISITHRLSLAAMADRVFVLQAGRLVEEGPHAELIHTGGLYQHLYEEQTGYVTASGTPRLGVEADRLRSIPLFAGLAGESLATLAEQLTRERYGAGGEVVRQGDPGDKLYIISQGQAEVLVAGGASERRVNVLNDGDYFGEMALLAGEPRIATVRTTQPTEFYSLTQADFRALLDREPAIRDAVTQTVAGRRAALAAA